MPEIPTSCRAFSELHSLKQSLECGTNCGSCLPELRRLVAA